MITYENGKTKYEMKVDEAKKILYLKAYGFFSEKDGKSYLTDYDKIVKTFKPENFYLIIDGTELKASSPEVAEMLGTLLERYIKIPFKKRFLITKGSTITINQFKRLGNLIPGWESGVKYVDTVEAAEQSI